MSTFALTTRRALVALSFLALITTAAGADTVERTFDVRPGGKLILDTDLGSVDVRTTADSQVRIKVEREAGSGRDEDFELRFEQRGDDVVVEGERPGGGWSSWGSRNRFKVHFEIEVPEEYDLDIETSGGSIAIADLRGDVDCNTSGGSVRVADIAGRVDCRTSGGSVHIGRVEGSVLAKSSGGSITIDRSGGSVVASTSGGSVTVNEVMGSIDASTSGGNVTARMNSQPQADCRLSTSGGNIDITLASAVAVDLDAKTSGGEIHLEMPVTIVGNLSKTSVRGSINGGGPQLYLRTSGGNIQVKEL
jgi:DUF4097 and DUF4098 domain-containing protein YvlB